MKKLSIPILALVLVACASNPSARIVQTYGTIEGVADATRFALDADRISADEGQIVLSVLTVAKKHNDKAAAIARKAAVEQRPMTPAELAEVSSLKDLAEAALKEASKQLAAYEARKAASK